MQGSPIKYTIRRRQTRSCRENQQILNQRKLNIIAACTFALCAHNRRLHVDWYGRRHERIYVMADVPHRHCCIDDICIYINIHRTLCVGAARDWWWSSLGKYDGT